MTASDGPVYWDTSAILAWLFREDRHDEALAVLRQDRPHLLTSLAWAETLASLERVNRRRPDLDCEQLYRALRSGPWDRAEVLPDWDLTQALSRTWSLYGADLWHLAAALTLQRRLPIRIFTFDSDLGTAAEAEGVLLA